MKVIDKYWRNLKSIIDLWTWNFKDLKIREKIIIIA
jgi:hypothetical protein